VRTRANVVTRNSVPNVLPSLHHRRRGTMQHADALVLAPRPRSRSRVRAAAEPAPETASPTLTTSRRDARPGRRRDKPPPRQEGPPARERKVREKGRRGRKCVRAGRASQNGRSSACVSGRSAPKREGQGCSNDKPGYVRASRSASARGTAAPIAAFGWQVLLCMTEHARSPLRRAQRVHGGRDSVGR